MGNNFTKKVLVAMSGGVDSAVAAALLKKEGYEVIGATMILYCSSKAADKGCCGFSAQNDAKRVADVLDVPHYTLNFKDEFKQLVTDNFIEEYKNGRTPNPCVRCNRFIKFEHLMRKARELGADIIATGHYSQIMPSPPIPLSQRERGRRGGEGFKLLKGKDKRKDQSYVLYTMTQENLAHTLFPLGEMTKEEVRKKAKKLGLPVHDKEESQDICFVGDDNYIRFLKKECPEAVKHGPILDKSGKVVGQHEGIAFYTLGQRKGVGSHRGKPKYVIRIDRQTNTIVVGDQDDTLGSELTVDQATYVSGKAPTEPLNITAKIRYNSPEAEAVLYPGGKVVFKEPQRAITPGQSVVFYKEEEVIGGGVIA